MRQHAWLRDPPEMASVIPDLPVSPHGLYEKCT